MVSDPVEEKQKQFNQEFDMSANGPEFRGLLTTILGLVFGKSSPEALLHADGQAPKSGLPSEAFVEKLINALGIGGSDNFFDELVDGASGTAAKRILNHFNSGLENPFDPRLFSDLPKDELNQVRDFQRLYEGTGTIPSRSPEEMMELLESSVSRSRENMQTTLSLMIGLAMGRNVDSAIDTVNLADNLVGVKTDDNGQIELMEVYSTEGKEVARFELIEKDGELFYQAFESMTEKTELVPYDIGVSQMGFYKDTSWQNPTVYMNAVVTTERPVESGQLQDKIGKAIEDYLNDDIRLETINYTVGDSQLRNLEVTKDL